MLHAIVKKILQVVHRELFIVFSSKANIRSSLTIFWEQLLGKKKYFSSWDTQSIHGLTQEFREDNVYFVTVVSEKEECYHYLVPSSYSYIVGDNL